MFIANASYPDIYNFDIENKYYLFNNKNYTQANKSFYANIE
jgi:hypothetical protein